MEETDVKVATAYEALRRREYELITDLLEVLPKIDTLDQERVAQVRDALFHADHPYLMVFVGPFSSGKSSLINVLLGETDLLPVGPTPTTDRISILRWGEEAGRMRSGDVDTVFHPSPLLKKVSFVDTPGLESIFKEHEETTRKFLHRSDTVLLVMLATQAMTQRNLEYLRMLREYGKHIIVIINQADLLTPEEAETVRNYVLEQSQEQLGFKPDVWLVSARRGLEARAGAELDEELWRQSGLYKIEEYVDEQLSDVTRLRHKLQTPLQITQRVHQAALDAVRANQAALDHYQKIADNIDQQLQAQRREQERTVREINDEVSSKFGEAAMRGSEAIRDMFRLSRALGSTARGALELIGLGGLARRSQGGSYTRTAFEARRAFEPINALPLVSGKLGPRLEGRDVQDFDDLVKYARREIDSLPPSIQEKLIGTVQAPVQYDRSHLLNAREALEEIENEARVFEVEQLERTVRNTLLYLAAWEAIAIVLIALLFGSWEAVAAAEPTTPVVLLMLLLAFALLGFLILPLRGRMLEHAYTNRMLKLQARYIETLTKAADEQIEYSMGLRRQVVQPLTRLVEAQTQIQTDQLNRLQKAQQEMAKIEADLATLGRKRLVGLRG
ncbi:MAG: dynamin family protein [Chloroflexota bacterium]